MPRRLKLALMVLLGLPHPVGAQTADGVQMADSTRRRGVRVFGYPYAFYSPEASLAFGVGGIVSFRTGADTILRPSKVLVSAYYTTNAQYKVTLAHDLFLDANRTSGSLRASFGEFIDKFYGTGPEAPDSGNPAYLMQLTSLEANVSHQLHPEVNLKLGAILRADHQVNIDKQDNYFLVQNTVTGSDGGWVNGIGANLIWDTRDNVFYPTRGGFSDVRTVFYRPAFGSAFNFTDGVADLRWYHAVGGRHVIGVQAYGAVAGGDPPYFRLPKLGGGTRMRGYYEGRYRDRIFLMGQAEYRTFVSRRFGVVGFAAVGDVAHDLPAFEMRNVKFSAGFGLRYLFDRRERINIRADFGFGRNTSGVYFAIEEAF